ncbi:UNVERIFIED_CONTAM: hypothetical protein GTU68_048498 [Idotea baltica]|nr:hypothetical protein [Idotea baltica]
MKSSNISSRDWCQPQTLISWMSNVGVATRPALYSAMPRQSLHAIIARMF